MIFLRPARRPLRDRTGVVLLAGALLLSACSSQRPFSATSHVPTGSPLARYTIGSRFGEHRGGHRRHEGVDLLAKKGDTVVATADGTVIAAGRGRSGYGRLVCIDHGNGTETRYAHLSRVAVRVGQEIQRGDRVGAVGRSGNATTAHLHYELRVDGRAVDPSPSLGRSSNN